MSALSVWVDESQIVASGKTYWLIGQLIVRPEVEFEFLSLLRKARSTCKTWDTFHGCHCGKHRTRLWDLAKEWISVFMKTDGVFFHAFVFPESKKWKDSSTTPHHYAAKQIAFGLGNKMRSTGYGIQTLFKGTTAVTMFLDRKSENQGFTVAVGDGKESMRDNGIEEVYEGEIRSAILRQSGKEDLVFHLSFVNSKCFDAIQLCDCLTHAFRDQFLKEAGEPDNNDFLELMNDKVFAFSSKGANCLKDLWYSEKVNYFQGK